jgi:hypothetical protein
VPVAGPERPVIGRPPGIPPLVEEVPVRFSPVPVPPVPRWDDVPEAPTTDELVAPPLDAIVAPPAPAEPEATEVRFTPVEPPAPEPEPVAEAPAAPTPLDEVPEYRRTLEPTPLDEVPEYRRTLEPTPLDEVPEYRRDLEPEPISVLAPPEVDPAPDAELVTADLPTAAPAPSDGLGPAPTAASVFGGQRGAELAAPVPPAEADDAEGATPVLRFDLVDDDLLPVARRRSRR